MSQTININDFLQMQDVLCIDVRSEGEYEQGHFPGAVNTPLLHNAERALVGTTYKQKGREEAVLKGFEVAGHKFAEIVKQVRSLNQGKQVRVYCWRGGMRSNIVAWTLNLAGFNVSLLKGGYKSFRHWSLNKVEEERNLIILGGYTGSGKTIVLNDLSKAGESVLDLESMASHKGSAFGAIGMGEQPTTEHFQNKLAVELHQIPLSEVIWVENESRMIGSVKIPDTFFGMMRAAPVAELKVSFKERLDYITKTYGVLPKKELSEATKKVKKRLGDLRCRKALEHIENNEMREWGEILLAYYDKFYEYGNSQRAEDAIFKIECEKAGVADLNQLIKIKKSIYSGTGNNN